MSPCTAALASTPAERAAIKRLQSAILERLERAGGGLSFVALCREVEGFAGELECTHGEQLVLWQGVSEIAIAALNALQAAGRIVFLACHPQRYIHDGATLRLPIAKRRDYPFKRPYWYPVMLATPEQIARHTHDHGYAPREAEVRDARPLERTTG